MNSIDAYLRRFGGINLTSSEFGGIVADHEHHASEVQSGAIGGGSVASDFWSPSWDGSIPADLSAGADPAATAGFYFDVDVGAVQMTSLYAEGGVLGDLTVTGTITLGAGSSIVGTYLTIESDGSIDCDFITITGGTITVTSVTTTGTAGVAIGTVDPGYLQWKSAGTLIFQDQATYQCLTLDAAETNPVSVAIDSTLVQVTAGANDSESAGYRCLRVPNS